MSRKTKNDLRKEVESLKATEHTVTVVSEVVEITDDMTDEGGNLIESKVPDPDPPDGFKLGDEIPTESAVVKVHVLGRK